MVQHKRRIRIAIPTRNRNDMLQRAIYSLPWTTSTNFDFLVNIINVGGKPGNRAIKWTEKLYANDPKFSIDRIRVYWDIVGAYNLAAKNARDAGEHLLLSSELIEFKSTSISHAYRTLLSQYPDHDGIVGIRQFCVPTFHPARVILIGNKFLDRYKDNELICPTYKCDYFHNEFLRFANSFSPSKFTLDKNAVVDYYSPEIHVGLQDAEYERRKPIVKKDLEFAKYRAMMGFTWGLDFNG